MRLAGACLATVAALSALSAAAVAGAATPASPAPAPASTPRPYYVAVGASESLGVQPTTAHPRGGPTNDGYANALVAMEQGRWPGLQLAHFGCPGITAEAALHGGGPCMFPGGSEIDATTDFVKDHRGRVVLATVDLGFNDVWPCLAHGQVDHICVAAALRRVAHAVPAAVRALRVAGGPTMTVVGLLHNDPFLAAYLHGTAGRRFSAATLKVIDRLNFLLDTVYRRAGAAVAHVPAAFSLGTSAPVVVAGRGPVPRDVAKVCMLSWMCARRNIHLTTAGYGAIASAIAAALPLAPTAR